MKQSKRKTAFRAVKMSLQIKSRLSKAVLILGIPAAFLPALIAKRLQAFTDELLRLQSGGSTVASCLELLLVLVIFFLNGRKLFHLRNRIQCGCRFIKNQDIFVTHMRSGNCYLLLLTSGKIDTSFFHFFQKPGLHSFRKPF